MTIKTLPVNTEIVTQENGWQCGPATTQNLIWAKKRIVVAESQLARELGTTVNGTDSIEYLDRVLGNHLGVDHATQWITNDPPTAEQVTTFWDRLRGAVDNGFGIGMNWIAPPSNYPRGVDGSQSPSYSGGTVYHYTAAVGYNDANRWVFVADSGFQPKTYWITVEQCMSLIAGKGYTYPILDLAPKFLSALTDAEQYELLMMVRWIADQLGVNRWGPGSSMGTDAAGHELTLRDGVAALRRDIGKL